MRGALEGSSALARLAAAWLALGAPACGPAADGVAERTWREPEHARPAQPARPADGAGRPSSGAAPTQPELNADVSGGGALPESALAGAAEVETIVGVWGDCLLLVMADELAPGCRGMLLNVTYKNGRSSFLFYDETEEVLVSFSGISGDDVRQGDSIIQPLDGVTVTRDPKTPEPESLRAVGSCRYTNPFTGVGTLSCVAETASGRWTGEFRTDGQPPTVTELG